MPIFNLQISPYLNNVILAPHIYPPSVTNAPSNWSGAGLNYRLSRSFGSKMTSASLIRLCNVLSWTPPLSTVKCPHARNLSNGECGPLQPGHLTIAQPSVGA
jgi:hypothetical protein